MAPPPGDPVVEEARLEYGSKLELMLTLVGYAVGVGNIWRFPYLTFSCGGGAFLIPYAIALCTLGYPLFTLELGLGQMLRQGTLGIWDKLGMHRFRGVGAAATTTCCLVALYYNVILTWTVYYLGRTLGALVTGNLLPWDDRRAGFTCPPAQLFPKAAVANATDLIDAATGLFNKAYSQDFWCPKAGEGSSLSSILVQPQRCPAVAAVQFWEQEALQQSSGMDDLGGMHWGLVLSYTVAWLIVYLCIFQGVASSGKVVYVTATLPYVALIVFFFRAVTLPNAVNGVRFFVEPDFALLADPKIWIKAVVQIFYSLGVGFGSLIAFASYGNKHSDFAKDAATVSIINCSTSVFAGFVVFPILGFLAHELSDVDPCIRADNLADLDKIGLSGTGLAFIAFPIAVSQMQGGFLWALLFFVMLLCLGIDSEFAMVESVITVLSDAGVGKNIPKPVFVAGICGILYLFGLIFVTRGGLYWFQLFNDYTCVVSMFFVTFLECIGLMWYKNSLWLGFADRVQHLTGRKLGSWIRVSWKFVCPVLLVILTVLAFESFDVMDALNSQPYPEGRGYYPSWSIAAGWILGITPIAVFFGFLPFGGSQGSKSEFSCLPETSNSDKVVPQEAVPEKEVPDVLDVADVIFKVVEEEGNGRTKQQEEDDKVPAGGALCCLMSANVLK